LISEHRIVSGANTTQLPTANSRPPGHDWRFACAACRGPLEPGSAGDLRCRADDRTYRCVDGIWRFLLPERGAYFRPFLRDYTTIRTAEGYGYDGPEQYRRLPEVSPDDPLAWQWRMRARSFAELQRRVLGPMGKDQRPQDGRPKDQRPRVRGQRLSMSERRRALALGPSSSVLGTRPGLRILDLGAGVSWLCNRLASLGHWPCGVDLNDDPRDGLGAWPQYAHRWPSVQAEFDRLPLADAQADVVIYNAALPYSADYHVTLAEGLRVLRPGGRLVVMDSPIYRSDASGRQMVAERQAAFARAHGTRSDAVPSIGFLTWTMLRELGSDLGLGWQAYHPWYGWRWALRPWRARLLRQREPSRFALLVAERA
jgi:SAM-dependent methyltransferase